MPIYVEEILSLANRQLEDIAGITWPPDVLIPYLNLGILEIINLKPDAYPTTKNLTLVPGPIQTLPTGDINIIDIVCNMGAAGDTVGQTVTSLDKKAVDEMLPGWMTYPTSDIVSWVIMDDSDTKHFYVFPPQPDPVTQQLRATIETPHTTLQTINDVFPLDATYQPAVVDYLIYRALIEETNIQGANQKALTFYNKFLQDLGLMTNVEKQIEEKGR